MTRMTNDAFAATLEALANDAIDFREQEVSTDQAKAWEYYNGERFGDEIEGRSQVISRDVAEVIDWMMPDLMRIFTSGDKFVAFDPEGEGDEEQAEQATAYVNHIFWKDNRGFEIMYEWFKSALIQKNGIVKCWWDDTPQTHRETLVGLSTPQLKLLELDDEVEILEQDEEPLESQEQAQIASDPAAAALFEDNKKWTVKISRTQSNGVVRIEGHAPEQFLISRQAANADDADYKAVRAEVTVQQLMDDGLATAEQALFIGGGDSRNGEDGKSARFFDEEEDGNRADVLGREVWVFEEYVRIDFDGDGTAELRKVIRVDNTILLNEEVEDDPFAFITPDLQPHRFFGKSLADLVMDLQRINSVIWRQMLDNLYQANLPQTVVNSKMMGEDGIDDLLTPRIGGIIRVDGDVNTAMRERTVPFVAGQAFQMLEHTSTMQERRTGITRLNQGLDSETLNDTATGAIKLMAAAQGRKELIARVFAETGVRDLFRKILKLTVQNQDAPRTIRLTDKWVAMDPRHWNADMDVSVRVGIGTDDKEARPAKLGQILELQQQTQGLGVPPQLMIEKFHNTVDDIVNAFGVGNTSRYFPDVEEILEAIQQQPEQPDPFQQQLQLDAAKTQADNDTKLQEAQIKAETDLRIAQMNNEVKVELGLAEIEAEKELTFFKINVEARTNLDAGIVNTNIRQPN